MVMRLAQETEADDDAERRSESASQEGTQALRNRLVENVIIERVEEVRAIGFAGKKVADIAVDRGDCDPGLRPKAFCGAVHGELLVPQLGIDIWNECAPFGHVRCLTDDETPTVCNTALIPC